jgi:hypothetical protein
VSTPNEPLTHAEAEALTADTRPWLSCDDCFDRVQTCVEALLRAGRGLDEPMRVHLLRCPACCEEAESLVTLLALEDGTDPEGALRAFVRSL